MDIKFLSRGNSPIIEPHYWASQVIRKGDNLGDLSIAVRRQLPYGNPDRFYNIYVENGEVKTSIREYPDYYNKVWKEQFSLGVGSACALAFDGYWRMYQYKWRYITYEQPTLFWVDANGKLQTQYWDDNASRFELASNVTKVKAIRAWKNASYIDRDQGVVAGYIKSDGKVYYRNYCQQEDGAFTWEIERELVEFTGTAISLNLFITNDYRTGFVVEDSLGKIHWFITFQNWAGMAIPPENFSVSPVEVEATLIDIEYPKLYEFENISVVPFEVVAELLFARTDNQVLQAINAPITKLDELLVEYDDWGWVIELTFENPIPILSLGEVVVTNIDTLTPIAMTSIEKVDDFTFKLNVSDVVENGINNVTGDIKVSISGVLNPAGYVYQNMEKVFTPINLVPEFIPLPEVELIYNQ